MSPFSFRTDVQSEKFCALVADSMISLFGISPDEAVGRINRAWATLELLGDDQIIYHENEDFWANDIYYGMDSYWWTQPQNLKPLPYP